VHALVKLQNDKFTLIMTSLVDLSPEDWTFLPSFVFTTDELAEASGIDRSLIDRIVNAFVLPRYERNTGFRAIDDFNAVSAMPILPVGDGRFLLLEQYTLEQSLYESPFYWTCEDWAYRDIALRNRGRFVEFFAWRASNQSSGNERSFPMSEFLRPREKMPEK
jgi:hypothetical protein